MIWITLLTFYWPNKQFHDVGRFWCMVYNGIIPRGTVASNGGVWWCMVVYGGVWWCMVVYGSV